MGSSIKITGRFLAKTNFGSLVSKKNVNYDSITLICLIYPWYLKVLKKQNKPKTKKTPPSWILLINSIIIGGRGSTLSQAWCSFFQNHCIEL